MFGFGGSKNESSSSSNAYGYSGSSSLSESLQRAMSRSGGNAVSGSSQAIAFEELFARLFGGAEGAAQRASSLVPTLQGEAATLFSGGMNFLDQLQGGPGTEYLEGRLNDPGVVDQQIGLLGEDLGRFLREEINPAIASRGVAAGTFGSGRQKVAQGIAARGVADQFQRGAVELRSRDTAMRDAVARDLVTQRSQAAGVGLNALPSLLGLAGAGVNAEFAPYQALAQILGGPQALTTSFGESSDFSESSSEAIARAISEAFGEDWATSQSKSKGRSFDLGW